MKELHLPAVLQQQRMSNTAWPASLAVGVQGASCCSCQDGFQVVCQLLHCGDVTGRLEGNIDQPALLSQHVGSEHCTPCQPAILTYTHAEGVYIGRKRKAKQGQGNTVCGFSCNGPQCSTRNAHQPIAVALTHMHAHVRADTKTSGERCSQ